MQPVLVIDVGGTHVKVLASGEQEPRRIDSGPKLQAAAMSKAVLELVADWAWDVVSIGVPSPVHGGRIVAEPVNLGSGWVGFDYTAALGKPTRVVNDAAMQALGSYENGKMLFLGLGTGLGSALVADGYVQPMELAHLPFRKKTFEDYVGEQPSRSAARSAGVRTFSTLSARCRPRSSRTTSCSAAGTRSCSRSCPTASCWATTRTRSKAGSASGTTTRLRA